MGAFRGLAAWVVVVGVVFLVQGWLSDGALVFGDDDGLVEYESVETSELMMDAEFGHFLDRKLLQVTGSDRSNTTIRKLVVRGDRRDPTNGFKKYRDGYDVKSSHYWASVVYTGVYGFAIGVAWLLLGALITLLACFRCCCCRRKMPYAPRNRAYFWIPRILAFLLSLFAIGVIITMFIRNRQLHTQAFNIRDSIATSANDATGAVRNVTTTLTTVETLVTKYNIQGLNSGIIGSTVASLNNQSDTITNKVNTNIRTLNRLINGIEIALIVMLSITLFLVAMGMLAALMGWRTVYFLIILLGWLITALTWLLFGLFFAVNNVTTDTCQAFTEYLQAPANTTLDELLPCVDLATAASASNVVKQGVNNIVLQANNALTQIEQVSASLGRPTTLPPVCDPIGAAPDFNFTTCPNGTVLIGGVPQVVAPYVCPSNPVTTACLAQGRFVNSTQEATIKDLSIAGNDLVAIIPTVNALTNCSFVYDTFSKIVNERCPPARKALRNLWISLLLLSIALTLLTVSWIFANHRNKKPHLIHDQEYSPTGTTARVK
ncbi:hypothetical protein KC19_8G026600 [Ceratodon purpureus]|uniref:Transmembrane protein n=1 Tax=Ceratodon purpureus TaxID=3225 RepID=A0A8T0GWV1_CERPU|nr:hypothetical protein KC19_8G026600 [Ceratodon purpureus]